ncbi:hypothetical protein E2C01_072021 [Portunus trituberculatus]|uniref:Uncharacterized protein n=1 Tax=Portunus trituberculatus TaxID=210409 RepID=A0A5B7IA02_PORTR|nr:hypothetical protein [Portunus trituberculatus]
MASAPPAAAPPRGLRWTCPTTKLLWITLLRYVSVRRSLPASLRPCIATPSACPPHAPPHFSLYSYRQTLAWARILKLLCFTSTFLNTDPGFRSYLRRPLVVFLCHLTYTPRQEASSGPPVTRQTLQFHADSISVEGLANTGYAMR